MADDFHSRLTQALAARDADAARRAFDAAFWRQEDTTPAWHHLYQAIAQEDRALIRLVTAWGAAWTAEEAAFCLHHLKDKAARFAVPLRAAGIDIRIPHKNYQDLTDAQRDALMQGLHGSGVNVETIIRAENEKELLRVLAARDVPGIERRFRSKHNTLRAGDIIVRILDGEYDAAAGDRDAALSWALAIARALGEADTSSPAARDENILPFLPSEKALGLAKQDPHFLVKFYYHGLIHHTDIPQIRLALVQQLSSVYIRDTITGKSDLENGQILRAALKTFCNDVPPAPQADESAGMMRYIQSHTLPLSEHAAARITEDLLRQTTLLTLAASHEDLRRLADTFGKAGIRNITIKIDALALMKKAFSKPSKARGKTDERWENVPVAQLTTLVREEFCALSARNVRDIAITAGLTEKNSGEALHALFTALKEKNADTTLLRHEAHALFNKAGCRAAEILLDLDLISPYDFNGFTGTHRKISQKFAEAARPSLLVARKNDPLLQLAHRIVIERQFPGARARIRAERAAGKTIDYSLFHSLLIHRQEADKLIKGLQRFEELIKLRMPVPRTSKPPLPQKQLEELLWKLARGSAKKHTDVNKNWKNRNFPRKK